MEFSYTEESQVGKEGLFVNKVLGFTGLAVLFTGLVGWVYGRMLLHFFSDGAGYLNETGLVVLLAVLAIALLSSLLVSIFATAWAWKSHKTPIVWYVVYILTQGLFFGSVVALGVEPFAIGLALGITAIAFLICFGIGYLSKGRVKGARLALTIIGVGMLIHFFTFGIWYLVFPTTLLFAYPLISFIFFIVASLYIIIDANNVKNRIDDGYELTNALALTCAFTLYTDFMYLFWKILRIVIIIFGKSKR